MPDGVVAIVDDDEAIRMSTASLLTRAGFGVKLFESGDDFLRDPAPEQFSCIVLDIRMPGSNGLAVLRALRDRGDSVPVLVVTGHGDIGLAVQAMRLGAEDFIEKNQAAVQLVAAIERAMGRVLAAVDRRIVQSDAAALVDTLTERQRQVLQGILRGLQNKLIAYELGLSIRTIEAYRSQLLTRLGVRSTAEAVRLAIAAGLGDGTPAPAFFARAPARQPDRARAASISDNARDR